MSTNTAFPVAVLGATGVGKTSIVWSVLGKPFTEHEPTIENVYEASVLVDDKDTSVEIADTSGHADFAFMQRQWIKQNRAFLFVYDITSQESFDAVRRLYASVNTIKEKTGGGERCLVVLIGNKCDLEADRVVPTANGEELAAMWPGATFFETSAKQDKNTTTAMREVLRQIWAQDDAKARASAQAMPAAVLAANARAARQGTIRSLESHELRLRSERYMRQHPELDEMLHDFIVEVLEHTPTDIVAFAAAHFDKL